MNKDRASKVLSGVACALAVLLAVGVMTFASACVHDDGSTSVCHAAQLAVAAGGAVAAVLAVVSLSARSARVAGVALLACAACGAFAALAPGVAFPLCMMATMRCHIVMQPFAQFTGVALAAVSLVAGIRALRAGA